MSRRPTFINLLLIRLPITAISSISHRVSGIVNFFIAIPTFVLIFLTGCSLNKNSKFWSTSETLNQETKNTNISKSEEILKKSSVYEKEFNQNLKIKTKQLKLSRLISSINQPSSMLGKDFDLCHGLWPAFNWIARSFRTASDFRNKERWEMVVQC